MDIRGYLEQAWADYADKLMKEVDARLESAVGGIKRGGKLNAATLAGTIPLTSLPTHTHEGGAANLTVAEIDGAPSAGSVSYIKVSNGKLTDDGGGTVTLDLTGGTAAGMTNPMTTAGDMIYGGAGGAGTALPIGTAGQVLKVNPGATAPEWAAAQGVTNGDSHDHAGGDGALIPNAALAADVKPAILSAPTVTGLLTLSDGQIAFPAAQSASADPNTLDDYEEGTWTPSLRFGATTPYPIVSVQSGTYTKVGNMVRVSGRITVSNLNGATGAAKIADLPFVVGAITIAAILTAYITFTGQLSLYTSAGSVLSLFESKSGSAFSTPDHTAFANNSDILFNIVYRV